MTTLLRRAATAAFLLPLAACAGRPAAVAASRGAQGTAATTAAAPVHAPERAQPAPRPAVAAAPVAGAPVARAPVAGASGARTLVPGPIPFDGRDMTLEAAMAAARGRPVAMYFLASWCGFCRKMQARTLSDQEVQAAMGDWYDVFVDPDSAAGKPLAGRYTSGAYPTTVLFDASGNVRQRLVGARDPGEFAAALRANR